MTSVTFYFKQAVWIIAFVMLSACGNEIARLDDDDLRKKVQECDYATNMNAASHQACDNYRRECKRRLEIEGRFVCK